MTSDFDFDTPPPYCLGAKQFTGATRGQKWALAGWITIGIKRCCRIYRHRWQPDEVKHRLGGRLFPGESYGKSIATSETQKSSPRKGAQFNRGSKVPAAK